MDCGLPGPSVHKILQARILEWVATHVFQGIFPTQGSNLGLPHCGQTLYPLSHQGSIYMYGWIYIYMYVLYIYTYSLLLWNER